MNFRKQRCPQTGASNLDYHSIHSSQNIAPHHTIETLSQPRNHNFSTLLEQRMKKVLLNPMQETKQFYHEVNKNEKIKTIVSQGRSSQLEEKEKRKRVFTGDSNLIFDEKVYLKQEKGGLSPKKGKPHFLYKVWLRILSFSFYFIRYIINKDQFFL